MITAHRHRTLANAGKAEALVALFPAFREALGGLQSLTRREVLNGQPLSRWRVMSNDALPFPHRLSARQMKSVQNMTHAVVSGWQESLVGRVRELITGSTLPEQRKTVLYRINAGKSWWAKELALPWTLDAASFSAALFATSDGQLLGRAMLHRLRELDGVLTTVSADLQKRGICLKTDRYYRRLQNRITGYVSNEIGRLLNWIAARSGDHAVLGLVAEKLDFRGGGLSRRMNRIATRTARKVLQARLAALTARQGIAVTQVPSPWTSCQCCGCGYTAKTNRKGPRFGCGFCGLTLHADVNAVRVILSRRSRHTPDHTGPRSRKNTLHLLDSQHRKRWGLPAAGAVPGIAGALGQST